MELNKVKHIKIEKEMKVFELVAEMQKSGVMGAGKIGKASEVILDMFNDKECKVFLGVAGALVPGGMREILIDMLESGRIDVFVCTGAALTHDLVEALGFYHYIGHHLMNDAELNKESYDRMYDSLMPNNVYEPIEKFLDKNIDKFTDKRMNIREFLWILGSLSEKRSILKICFDKKIPIFCPAIADSGIGLMIWGQLCKNKKIEVDAFDDLKEIIDISWAAKKRGVIYLGGGTPKNYIQQAMQFSKGADYAVQITTDRPEPGGSSGAPLKEGISWGKLYEKSKYVDVFCDVTIALPLIWGFVKEKIFKEII